MSVSVRAERFWSKLRDWYGTALTDQYGAKPPVDWCAVIDNANNDTVRDALTEIKIKHVTFPPRFPEVAAIFSRLQRPVHRDASLQEKLREFALRYYKLTPNQIRLPWEDLYAGQSGYPGVPASSDFAITGVLIPSDGEHPGFRIMVIDMQQAAA